MLCVTPRSKHCPRNASRVLTTHVTLAEVCAPLPAWSCLHAEWGGLVMATYIQAPGLRIGHSSSKPQRAQVGLRICWCEIQHPAKENDQVPETLSFQNDPIRTQVVICAEFGELYCAEFCSVLQEVVFPAPCTALYFLLITLDMINDLWVSSFLAVHNLQYLGEVTATGIECSCPVWQKQSERCIKMLMHYIRIIYCCQKIFQMHEKKRKQNTTLIHFLWISCTITNLISIRWSWIPSGNGV